MGEGFGGQARARCKPRCTAFALEFIEERGIVGRIDDDRDRFVVLRRRAQHRRTADVDILDCLCGC